MPAKNPTFARTSVPPTDAKDFADSLRRRREAAKGLQQDLITEVPLLYGSADSLAPEGDAGIVLARAHREEMVRRNGAGYMSPSGTRSEVALPFERATAALALLLFVWLLFAR